jgi:hypothetical protein
MPNIIKKLTGIFKQKSYAVGSITKIFNRPTNSPFMQNLVLEFKDGTIVELVIEFSGSNDIRLV